jgi:dihydroflavonol-4-reductase
MNRVNVQGTVELFRAAAAAGVTRIVYTSSVATLRLSGSDQSADEESHAQLSDIIGAYKQSKFLAEEKVKRLVHDEKMPIVITKPTAPFGPGDVKPTPTGRMVIDTALGRTPAYVNKGLNVIHVDDVAAGHLLAYEKGIVGESYILGGENKTLRWILENLARLCGRRPPLVCLPHWAVMPAAYMSEGVACLGWCAEPRITIDSVRMARKLMYFPSAKARRELGYAPRAALDALRDALEWFYENGYVARRQ